MVMVMVVLTLIIEFIKYMDKFNKRFFIYFSSHLLSVSEDLLSEFTISTQNDCNHNQCDAKDTLLVISVFKNSSEVYKFMM